MGLDMYLTKELFLSKYGNDDRKSPREKLSISHPDFTIPEGKVGNIVVDVLQWRKANAVHAWFVDNVQDGDDDGDKYKVTKKQLQELLKISKNASKAYNRMTTMHTDSEEPIHPEEILPTKSGFFFGSTEYDDMYEDDLQLTIRGLEAELAEYEEGWTYYYYASW